MLAAVPRISVVVATRNRADRVTALLSSLEAQTIPGSDFEVLVVDDRSTDRTPEVLARESERGKLRLRVLRRAARGGPAAARNDGWRAAEASLVAFTDDDCVADPAWLEQGLDAWNSGADVFIQGRTEPDTREPQSGPRVFTHTLTISELGPFYETCNMFYPRALLARLGGFDAFAFRKPVPGGEDTDLAWRAIETGARPVFCPEALVLHAVTPLGPVGKLRHAARWGPTMQIYRRHPGVRSHLNRGVFWKGTHYLVFRLLVAALLPRRLWPIRRWLALAYFTELPGRVRREGISGLAAPYLLLHDLVEFAAVASGAIRYRTLVL